MKIQLIRHATVRLSINNKTILVDPVLQNKGTIPCIPNVTNTNNNPLIELPIDINTIINTDAILLTHTHGDHFDKAAEEKLNKDTPIFCQTEDEEKVRQKGFHVIYPIKESHYWEGITFNRTGGKHGTGIVAKQMGTVSGYVITTSNQPSLYITGDTVWCKEVQDALEAFNPEIIICFAGAAQLTNDGSPITMNADDIACICKKMPKSKIVVVHMEAWNHCMLTRQMLREYLEEKSLSEQVLILEDGEIAQFD